MVLAGITGQWGKGHSSALQKEGMETHKSVLDMSDFQVPEQGSDWH